MRSVRSTEAAVFLMLHPFRVFLFILGGRVISLFTLSAFQGYYISHLSC
jgi:hypothetical protein